MLTRREATAGGSIGNQGGKNFLHEDIGGLPGKQASISGSSMRQQKAAFDPVVAFQTLSSRERHRLRVVSSVRLAFV
jgi:hypothetical protein